MKKATKIAFGAVAVLAVSAGVAGVTTYTLMQSRQDKNLSFMMNSRQRLMCAMQLWMQLACSRLI
mgnify:FL=1